MEVRDVTQLDGKMCGQLINLLKAGKWELSGVDIVAHTDTMKWVHDLAVKMAKELKPTPPTTPPIIVEKPKIDLGKTTIRSNKKR